MVINRRGFLEKAKGILALSNLGSIDSHLSDRGNGDNSALSTDLGTEVPCSVVRTNHTDRSKVIGSDEWIIHQASWVTVGDEGPQALRDLLNATRHEFFIDDSKIDDPCEHWRLIRPQSSRWGLHWRYLTAPKSVGKHSFRVEVEFDEPLKTRQDPGLTTLRGFRRYMGRYSVVP